MKSLSLLWLLLWVVDAMDLAPPTIPPTIPPTAPPTIPTTLEEQRFMMECGRDFFSSVIAERTLSNAMGPAWTKACANLLRVLLGRTLSIDPHRETRGPFYVERLVVEEEAASQRVRVRDFFPVRWDKVQQIIGGGYALRLAWQSSDLLAASLRELETTLELSLKNMTRLEQVSGKLRLLETLRLIVVRTTSATFLLRFPRLLCTPGSWRTLTVEIDASDWTDVLFLHLKQRATASQRQVEHISFQRLDDSSTIRLTVQRAALLSEPKLALRVVGSKLVPVPTTTDSRSSTQDDGSFESEQGLSFSESPTQSQSQDRVQSPQLPSPHLATSLFMNHCGALYEQVLCQRMLHFSQTSANSWSKQCMQLFQGLQGTVLPQLSNPHCHDAQTFYVERVIVDAGIDAGAFPQLDWTQVREVSGPGAWSLLSQLPHEMPHLQTLSCPDVPLADMHADALDSVLRRAPNLRVLLMQRQLPLTSDLSLELVILRRLSLLESLGLVLVHPSTAYIAALTCALSERLPNLREARYQVPASHFVHVPILEFMEAIQLGPRSESVRYLPQFSVFVVYFKKTTYYEGDMGLSVDGPEKLHNSDDDEFNLMWLPEEREAILLNGKQSNNLEKGDVDLNPDDGNDYWERLMSGQLELPELRAQL